MIHQEQQYQSILQLGILVLEMITHAHIDSSYVSTQQLPLSKSVLANYMIKDCPEELEALVYWCCDANPNRRPSIGQCWMELDAIYRKYFPTSSVSQKIVDKNAGGVDEVDEDKVSKMIKNIEK